MNSERNLPLAMLALITLATLACVFTQGIQDLVDEQAEQFDGDLEAGAEEVVKALDEDSGGDTGILPEEASNLPLPPDAEIVQSAGESDDISGNLGSIQYATNLSIDELIDFYRQSLPPLGLFEQPAQSNVNSSEASLIFIDEEGRRSVYINMGSPIPVEFETLKSTLVLIIDIQLAPLAAMTPTPASEASWELTQVSYFGTSTETTAIGLVTNTGDVVIEVDFLVSFFNPAGGKPFQHDLIYQPMWCVIYPGQTVPLTSNYIHSFDPNPEIAAVEIDLRVEWPRPDQVQYIEDFNINDFEVVRIDYTVLSSDSLNVSGELRNVSNQDLRQVNYTIMLYDPSGILLAAKSPVQLYDLVSDQESFTFQITIEGVPADQVARADAFACANPVP